MAINGEAFSSHSPSYDSLMNPTVITIFGKTRREVRVTMEALDLGSVPSGNNIRAPVVALTLTQLTTHGNQCGRYIHSATREKKRRVDA